MNPVLFSPDATLPQIGEAFRRSYCEPRVFLSMDGSLSGFLVKYHGDLTLVKVWLRESPEGTVVVTALFEEKNFYSYFNPAALGGRELALAFAHRFACFKCACILFDEKKKESLVPLWAEYQRLQRQRDALCREAPESQGARLIYELALLMPLDGRMFDLSERMQAI